MSASEQGHNRATKNLDYMAAERNLRKLRTAAQMHPSARSNQSRSMCRTCRFQSVLPSGSRASLPALQNPEPSTSLPYSTHVLSGSCRARQYSACAVQARHISQKLWHVVYSVLKL